MQGERHMSVEQLLVVLPGGSEQPTGNELSSLQWAALLEQFKTQGGREVFLGGLQPLAFPGFWMLARRCVKAGVQRVTAYLSGSLLEPWVLRELVESGIHVVVALDSLQAEAHEALHGPGTHKRAFDAVERLLKQGLAERIGILATATTETYQQLPVLAAWAAGRGVSRFLWNVVPTGGWPVAQLKALQLSPEAKAELANQMQTVARQLANNLYVGPLDPWQDYHLGGFSQLLRVTVQGEATWGFDGEGGRLGNVKRALLSDLLIRANQAAGD
jgi:MoaA/NifB/PqqE/SkfB family radical SAM enzyme